MKAIILEEIGKYAIVEKPVPEIRRGNELLVKIDACSICGSDMHILSDPPGYPAAPGTTLGHEMVGTIVSTGSEVTSFAVGDRIVCDNNIPCGHCYYCRSGHANMCEHVRCLGVNGDGFFAQYAVIPDDSAYVIGPELPLDIAIFAEPLNCVMGAMDKLRMIPGETVAVIGAGPIGLYFIQLLKKNGAGTVIAVEPSEFRRKMAKEAGADIVVLPAEAEKLPQIAAIGADIVVDAVGSCIKDALDWVRCSGRVLLFGQNFARTQEICQSMITRKELTVTGSYIGSYSWHDTIRLLEHDHMQLEKMITHRLALEDFAVGYEAMKNGSALEVILYPNGKK
ncbi:alcohol dehydrogenase catalytic domain-containing protein [Ruminococcus gauvreauii]|uniref:Alcohol dehydrogenase catalytic domain-containing protein n=1 Tax=Ruminococcus gauvreauii TaxID=438033 RepID=A0ABY5VE49_9FIRM|nr:alcohol dehydrogenase catalytic domain-containing protein [Ruminococcus gauvreauii]UWP58889.1 alcohol dehydrogenase catalytic domain-containing protein [Ruminococcus gauvreauii]